MIRKSITFAAVCLVLISAIVMAPGVSAQPSGDGPGNSANAKLCQKDGWKSLARSESSGVPFANQDECVSYGATGGEIVPHKRSLRIEWVPNECADGILHWEGFEPGTYQATWTLISDGTSPEPAILTESLTFTTSSGMMFATFGGSDMLFVTSVGIEIDGIIVSPIPVPCGQ